MEGIQGVGGHESFSPPLTHPGCRTEVTPRPSVPLSLPHKPTWLLGMWGNKDFIPHELHHREVPAAIPGEVFPPVFYLCLQKQTSVLPKTHSVTLMLNISCSSFCSSVELSSSPSQSLFICCILHFHKWKTVTLHF